MSRADRRVAWRLGCLVALALALFHRGHFVGSDEVGVFETTRAIAERGSLAVPPIPMAYRGRGGALYSQYAIGQSLLALPFYQVGELGDRWLPWRWAHALAGPDTVLMGRRREATVGEWTVGLYAPVMTGLLAAIFFGLQRRLGAGTRTASLASLCMAFGSYAALMGSFFLRHTTEAVLVLGALAAWMRFREDGAPRWLWLGAVLASAIPLVRLPAAVAGVGLAGYVLFVIWERRRTLERVARARQLVVDAIALALPLAVASAIHFGLNLWKWQAWLDSPMTAERGRLSLELARPLAGFLVSPGASIFVYSPLLLLLPWMGRFLWHTRRAEAATIGFVFVISLGFYSLYDGWTGLWSSPGPRYLFSAGILLLLPLGPWLEAGGAGRRRATLALTLIGVAVGLPFLLTEWFVVVERMGYQAWEPRFGFLFEPSHAPLVGALAALPDLDAWGLWLMRLARGFHGSVARPGAAGVVLVVWAAGIYALARALAGAVAQADDPDSLSRPLAATRTDGSDRAGTPPGASA